MKLGSDGRHEYHGHSDFIIHAIIQRPIRIADSDLAPLDEEQCVILDAINLIDVRYTVYRTPGLLEWGVGLKVGDIVLAQLPGGQYTTAIIRWIGMDRWNGHRFGVEIMVSSLLYHHIMTPHHNHHFCIRTP